MKRLKPLGFLLAAGLAATVVACDSPNTGAGDTPEGDVVAPAETTPEADPTTPEGEPTTP